MILGPGFQVLSLSQYKHTYLDEGTLLLSKTNFQKKRKCHDILSCVQIIYKIETEKIKKICYDSKIKKKLLNIPLIPIAQPPKLVLPDAEIPTVCYTKCSHIHEGISFVIIVSVEPIDSVPAQNGNVHNVHIVPYMLRNTSVWTRVTRCNARVRPRQLLTDFFCYSNYRIDYLQIKHNTDYNNRIPFPQLSYPFLGNHCDNNAIYHRRWCNKMPGL